MQWNPQASNDYPRWCAVCGTQRGTTKHNGVKVFVKHSKPDGKPCSNSEQPVAVAQREEAGHNQQVKVW